VLIPLVDDGLETLLRNTLPLRPDLGDVSFDAPSGTWSAQLSRITVNLFLFGVGRSAQPALGPAVRPRADGREERRGPLPMVDLSYLVSVYAGSTRDEHQLLSDVFSCFVNTAALPPDVLSQPMAAPVRLQVPSYENARLKDVWNGISGTFRPGFELVVTAALDSADWSELPTRVAEVTSLTRRR
jgi:hypothetical protein